MKRWYPLVVGQQTIGLPLVNLVPGHRYQANNNQLKEGIFTKHWTQLVWDQLADTINERITTCWEVATVQATSHAGIQRPKDEGFFRWDVLSEGHTGWLEKKRVIHSISSEGDLGASSLQLIQGKFDIQMIAIQHTECLWQSTSRAVMGHDTTYYSLRTRDIFQAS